MIYRSYTPSAPLSDFVERFWQCSDTPSHHRERILPSGTIELVINLREDEIRIYDPSRSDRCTRFSGAVVSGPYKGCFLIDPLQHAAIMGVHEPSLASFEARVDRIDEVEAMVAAWTSSRSRLDVAERLQAEGIEAVPVADFADLHDDPQLAHRGHWIRGEHPVLGRRWYERSGYRLPDDRGGFERAHAPLLGEDNAWLVREVLGLSDAEIAGLADSGAIETPRRHPDI